MGNSITPALKPLMGSNGVILSAIALVFMVMQIMKGRGASGKIARGSVDALMARQIASVMNRNFARSSNSSEDKFFADAGDQLTQAILMLAKGMPNPDLMTASAVLGLDALPARIMEGKRLGELGSLPQGWHISHWVYYAFSQLLQLKDSEKTALLNKGMNLCWNGHLSKFEIVQ